MIESGYKALSRVRYGKADRRRPTDLERPLFLRWPAASDLACAPSAAERTDRGYEPPDASDAGRALGANRASALALRKVIQRTRHRARSVAVDR